MGHSFLEILHDSLTRKLLGFDAVHAEEIPFVSGVSSRLTFLLQDATKHLSFLKIGYTALEAFLQANCTGPPLPFNPEESIFPDPYRDDGLRELKQELLRYLTIDGSAVYPLTPHIELFWLAKLIMSNSTLAEAGFNGRRARVRVNFWHQKLLNEKSDKLQDGLYTDVDVLEHQLSSRLTFGGAAAEEHFVEFLVERAQIRIYYGDDDKAREDLALATKTRHFQFALTGVLGKRTKFQINDLSQLVVLAKSRDHEPEPYSSRKSSRAEGMDSRKASRDEMAHTPPRSLSIPHSAHPLPSRPGPMSPTSPRFEHHVSPLAATSMRPENIPLNDDTLLEHIKFKTAPPFEPVMTSAVDSESLPPRLADLDPAAQPLLFPVDSIILLSTASSIQNTSPADGLTREETLPYAERVFQGGSSNWQVYTQALLVRSRIEGYKSRTAERGLLQLQACVDQVIAETSGTTLPEKTNGDAQEEQFPSTFLPKAASGESASVAERLKFIYQLSPPLRWELEAELASRWTSMGGLKTAMEIYERLQMHAEVALCLAATDNEGQAKEMLKDLLFDQMTEEGEIEPTRLKLKSPMPADAPRLLCILGDITNTPAYYELAWTASGKTYGRAQRSLGRYLVKQRQYEEAAVAYTLALQRGRIDHATWFALGCVQLELTDWKGAVESFNRCVMIDESDGEGWSNLAVALLRLPVEEEPQSTSTAVSSASTSPASTPEEDHEDRGSAGPDLYKNKRAALRALQRAAALKRDDARIWDNYLTVAASIPPSQGTPWAEIIRAMSRIIDLRGKREGEGCVDLKILAVLVRYVTAEFEYPKTADAEVEEVDGRHEIEKIEEEPEVGPTELNPDAPPAPEPSKPTKLPYVARALLELVDKQISPLVTSSAPLIELLARVAEWRRRPAEALGLYEKAWRATTNVPGGYESEVGWKAIVKSTEMLVEKYKEFGDVERERTGGKVEANWRFKARTAVRGVLGRGRELWSGTEEWGRLEGVMEELKA